MFPISVCDNGVTSASKVGSKAALNLSFLVAEEVLGFPPTAGTATVGAAAPAPPTVSGTEPKRRKQTLRNDSTLDCSTGVRARGLAGSSGTRSAWTVVSHTGLWMSTISRTLAGSPRATRRASQSWPSTPDQFLTPARSTIAVNSASVGSILAYSRAFV